MIYYEEEVMMLIIPSMIWSWPKAICDKILHHLRHLTYSFCVNQLLDIYIMSWQAYQNGTNTGQHEYPGKDIIIYILFYYSMCCIYTNIMLLFTYWRNQLWPIDNFFLVGKKKSYIIIMVIANLFSFGKCCQTTKYPRNIKG